MRFRPLLVPTLVFLPALAVLIGLGVWQLQRLDWKLALIARIERGLEAEPVDLDRALEGGLADAAWRKVRVEGRFLAGKDVYLFATSPGREVGAHVLTPLLRDAGDAFLIDRGFVPAGVRDESGATPSARTAVVGIVRAPEGPGLFTPPPDLVHRQWYALDPGAMADAVGVSLAAPIVIQMLPSPGDDRWPKPLPAPVNLRNDHLQYAIIWFALALVLVAVYLAYHRAQGRLSLPGDGR